MKISELIIELQKIQEQYGDLECYYYGEDTDCEEVYKLVVKEKWPSSVLGCFLI